ncbi:CRTAC1 family protein [Planktotalea sp.]|uniref:CRTAC1 family protein n=1 Tax=Planktotalea sp. TaxID=2029877 RepID=UPI0035C7AC20
MKRAVFACFALLTGAVSAEPLFENRSSALPEHSYSGGWEHFVGGGLAVFDCDGDELPDIFAAGGTELAQLIRNTGAFTFEPRVIPELTGVTGAYPIDVDADGFLDLFVLRAGPNMLLKGGGDCTFTDATEGFGLPVSDQWSTAFTAWWENGDQRPTFAIGNYVDREDPKGPFEACDTNAILRPAQTGYLKETLQPGFCSLSMLAAKDSRGRDTLRISNDRHYYVRGGREQMWDIKERRFLGEEDGWKRVSLWGMGIASRDLNGDGLDEVMLTSMGDQLLQFATQGGGYKAAPFGFGTYAHRPHVGDEGRPSTGWHAEFGDIDNDARVDLFIAKGNVDQMPSMAMRDPNTLLQQQVDGTFREISQFAGVASMDRSRGAALADFDLDGRLDLIVSNRRVPLELYRNVTPTTGTWIALSLEQAGGNRNAIGAVIEVWAEGVDQSVQHVIGGGHAGGQILPRHFGLGAAQVAQVRVTWPDGTQTERSLKAGARHIIIKP